MGSDPSDVTALLDRSLASDRIHSAYLLSGSGEAPRAAALRFVRGIACSGQPRPCDTCPACRRSSAGEVIPLDGTGKKGPLLRHVGDHADLLWIERGTDDTRVRIGQIRELQRMLRLGANEGGRRAAVIADAEWLNQESQNALLRLLEEPPPRTTLVLVATTSAGMLATVRSRCQTVAFPQIAAGPLDDEDNAECVARLESISAASVPDLLAWAEEFRGARAIAAANVEALLETASAWLQRRVRDRVQHPGADVRAEVDAARVLGACRKALVQRNANPQMVAERALFAVQEAAGP